MRRDVLEINVFERPRDYGEHMTARYGPTIAARANAAKDGREAEFDAALEAFSEKWNRGTPEQARFEKEYLLGGGPQGLSARAQNAGGSSSAARSAAT